MEKLNKFRERIYRIIEPLKRDNRFGYIYDIGMLVIILLSIVPLMFVRENTFLLIIDKSCVVIFIIDYILRWGTADFKFKDHSIKSFLKYPITPMAIIDLLSIIPSFSAVNNAFKLLRLVRGARILRLIRVIKLARYSKNMQLIRGILKKSIRPLITVGVFAVAYVAIAGLIAFNVEPEAFGSYFDAMYWTVIIWNYDPHTVTCHILAICSTIFGLSIVALPTSIITAEYINKMSHVRATADLEKEIKNLEKDVEKDLEKNLEKDIKKEIKKDLKETHKENP